MPYMVRQPTTKDELAKLDGQFVAWSPEERAQKWLEWVEVFATTTLEEEYNLRHSWFRFFTVVTWDDLNACDPDFFVDFVIGRQIPTAVLNNFPILNKIMFYLYFRTAGVVEMRDVYAQARDALTRSEAILGKWKDSYYTISQAMKELTLIKSRGRDAVEMASFMDKLRQTMFPSDGLTELYFTDNQDDALGHLVDTMDMFLEIEPDGIYSVVQVYVHPGINEEKLLELEEETSLPEKTLSRTWPRYIELPADAGTIEPPKQAAPMQAVKKVEEKINISAPKYPEIRAKIDAAFEVGPDGQYEDLDQVLNALEKAAIKYNDPKISELYYFDESSGKFKWSV